MSMKILLSFNIYPLKKISGWKWTNQNFLVKFIRILIKITGILVNTIFLVKSIRILIFIRIIISIRILLDLTRKFWFVYFPSKLLFNPIRPFFSVSLMKFIEYKFLLGLSGKFVPILRENWNAEDLNF